MVLAALVNCVAAADGRPGLTLQTELLKDSFIQTVLAGMANRMFCKLNVLLTMHHSISV
jgi:hypothetical protein